MDKLTSVFEPCEERGFHGYVKEIPGVHPQGEIAKETAENVLDALTLVPRQQRQRHR